MTRWYSEKKKEHYYKQAKKVGYRARSAFKLKQIQKKYKLIKKDNVVVDLGAAPGGWSQVCKEIVGESGVVIGIDISPIDAIKDIKFLKGDLTEDSTIQDIKDIVGNKKIDVILSDMSPDISGNYSIDHSKSIWLCENALKIVDTLLKSNGNFVCKAFSGEYMDDFVKKTREKFQIVKQFSPDASRKSSSEIYIIAKSYKS